MLIWRRGHVTEFLHEFLRRDGLGSHQHGPTCSTCLQPVPSQDPSLQDPQQASSPQTFLTRCRDCFGDCIECNECCVARHRRMPLHRTEEWTGAFWRTRSLHSLGVVVQLGHSHDICYHPDTGCDMTIIDSHGIHTVAVNFCACERSLTAMKHVQLLRAGWYPASMADPQTCATLAALEEFHLLNVKGALNVHDFIGAVSRRTNAAKITMPPVRTLCS